MHIAIKTDQENITNTPTRKYKLLCNGVVLGNMLNTPPDARKIENSMPNKETKMQVNVIMMRLAIKKPNVASTGERRSRESERSDRAWPCYVTLFTTFGCFLEQCLKSTIAITKTDVK